MIKNKAICGRRVSRLRAMPARVSRRLDMAHKKIYVRMKYCYTVDKFGNIFVTQSSAYFFDYVAKMFGAAPGAGRH